MFYIETLNESLRVIDTISFLCEFCTGKTPKNKLSDDLYLEFPDY